MARACLPAQGSHVCTLTCLSGGFRIDFVVMSCAPLRAFEMHSAAVSFSLFGSACKRSRQGEQQCSRRASRFKLDVLHILYLVSFRFALDGREMRIHQAVAFASPSLRESTKVSALRGRSCAQYSKTSENQEVQSSHLLLIPLPQVAATAAKEAQPQGGVLWLF